MPEPGGYSLKQIATVLCVGAGGLLTVVLALMFVVGFVTPDCVPPYPSAHPEAELDYEPVNDGQGVRITFEGGSDTLRASELFVVPISNHTQVNATAINNGPDPPRHSWAALGGEQGADGELYVGHKLTLQNISSWELLLIKATTEKHLKQPSWCSTKRVEKVSGYDPASGSAEERATRTSTAGRSTGS